MKLYLRVHYGWLPKEIIEGIPELDQAIEDALAPFGFHITGTNLDLGMRDLLFEADDFEIPVYSNKKGKTGDTDSLRGSQSNDL